MRIGRNMRKFVLRLGVLSFCLALAVSVGAVPVFAPRMALAADAASADVRTVVDMAGRSVALPAEIHRIGTLGSVGVLNAFVELMGEGSKIYNQMSAGFTKTDRWKMQYQFAPQIANGPLFEDANRELLLENILQARTDVCLAMTKETAQVLERNGVACVYLEWKNVDDVKKAVTLMGEVLNKKETADAYIAYFDEKLAQAASLTSGIPEKDRLKVLYGDPVGFSQPHIIAEWWIREAGGISVTDDGRSSGERRTYTLEDLLLWNPDVIVANTARQIEEMRGNPNYRGVAAVKNGRCFVIPTVAHVWGNRTVEQPLVVLWMMNKLYPELMPEATLREEIREFYATFFLYDMSDAQISEIINGK